jgi:N-methylhydantoinase A
MVLLRSVDARYSGQEYTISVPVLLDEIDDRALDEIRSRFHELHEQTYSHSSTSEPFEVTAVRVGAVGQLPHIEIPLLDRDGPIPRAVANVDRAQTCFDKEAGYVECDVWDRSQLLAGNTILGPAIVADFGATTIIPSDFVCSVEAHGMLVVDVPPR